MLETKLGSKCDKKKVMKKKESVMKRARAE